MKFLYLLLIYTNSLMIVTNIFAADQQTILELSKKLASEPAPNLGAVNWDIIDYAIKTKGELILPNINNPENMINIKEIADGNILVLAEINVNDKCYGKDKDRLKRAVESYTRLFEKYKDKEVSVFTVWTPGNKKDSIGKQCAEAKAFAKKHKIPGSMLLNIPGKERRSRGRLYEHIGSKIDGFRPGPLVAVITPDDRIAYRGLESIGFGYYTVSLMLDRLLDPDFDQKVRKEFFTEKTRILPKVEHRDDGLVYLDDFESYDNSYDFKLHPRWGFSYARQSRLDYRPRLADQEGRGQSTAVLNHVLADGSCYTTYGLRHRFPAPLKDGYLKFFIRRVPKDYSEKPVSPEYRHRKIRRSLCVRFDDGPIYKPAGFLFATGDWGMEKFCGSYNIDKLSDVKLTENWHEVKVSCVPGKMAELFVDGKKISDLESESINQLRFRLVNHLKHFYVDDVELFYKGDAEKIEIEHKSRQKTVTTVKPFTKKELETLNEGMVFQEMGEKRIILPEGHIPRKNILPVFKRSQTYITLDNPMELGDLIMVDVRKPDQLLNVTQKYSGKIIYISMALASLDDYLRPRTSTRNQTVYQKEYKLAKEYSKKGIVFVGLLGVDGGHRKTVNVYEDRIASGFESVWATKGMMEEMGKKPEEMIFGIFPDIYDDIIGEVLPNHTRGWLKCASPNRHVSFISGQFGNTPAFVLDPKGRVVFRHYGADIDGTHYWRVKTVLDRLLDPEFDKAYRQEFRNPELKFYQSPFYPNIEYRAEGITYRDDFESYENAYELGLQLSWGFSYFNYPSMWTPVPYKGKGINNSQAVLVNKLCGADCAGGNNQTKQLNFSHPFPVTLEDGHFSFHIKKGPNSNWKVLGMPRIYRLGITPYDEKGKALKTLTTLGEVGEDRYVLAPTEKFFKWINRRLETVNNENTVDLNTPFEVDDWVKISYICKKGKPIEIKIGEKSVGTLHGQALSKIEFRSEVPTSFYVDNAEIFYAGNTEELRQEHQQAVKNNFSRLQAEWRNEVIRKEE